MQSLKYNEHSTISCAHHLAMDIPSSSSPPSNLITATCLLGGSSGGGGESRALDRHNPIITDEKRSITKTLPNSSHPSPFTPKSSPLHQQKQTHKSKKKAMSKTNDQSLQIHPFRKSVSQPLDLTTIDGGEGECTVSKAELNYIKTSPESPQYVLRTGEDIGSSGSVDGVLSDFDPVSKLKALCDQPKRSSPTTSKPPLPSNSSSSSNHQVVVLKVSLHCKGCEGKVKKHLSKMQGVKSFEIEFAAKKVTVIGDVTPLEVITSISKVKNIQFLVPASS